MPANEKGLWLEREHLFRHTPWHNTILTYTLLVCSLPESGEEEKGKEKRERKRGKEKRERKRERKRQKKKKK